MGVLLFNRIRTMLLTVSLLFLSEVIRLLYAEKEITMLGQTGSTSLPNKIVRPRHTLIILKSLQILVFQIIKQYSFAIQAFQRIISLALGLRLFRVDKIQKQLGEL